MNDELDVKAEHELDQFDFGTSILEMTDGSLRLRFGLMPPSWAHDDGTFESFAERLAKALGVDVEGLDKELFGIAAPQPDTVVRLRGYLLELKRLHAR